jgi:hypothetical protein
MFEEKKECCLICGTGLKIKGLIMSGLLVGTAIATSVLTFTTNCQNVVQLANNQTMTVNDIGTANKFLSLSLLGFSVSCAVFERFINKKVAKLENEVDSLSEELAITKAQTHKTNRSSDDNVEIYNEPASGSGRSEVSYYPAPIRFNP